MYVYVCLCTDAEIVNVYIIRVIICINQNVWDFVEGKD